MGDRVVGRLYRRYSPGNGPRGASQMLGSSLAGVNTPFTDLVKGAATIPASRRLSSGHSAEGHKQLSHALGTHTNSKGAAQPRSLFFAQLCRFTVVRMCERGDTGHIYGTTGVSGLDVEGASRRAVTTMLARGPGARGTGKASFQGN